MPQTPPAGMPRISPMLFYNDVAAALEWLDKAFGLARKMSLPGPDGGIVHAEAQIGDGVVMLGPASEEQRTSSPADLPSVNQSLYVYVEDVDAHFARAKASGATITAEPTDMFWGDRMYAALDLEGHHWNFATQVKDVAPEDMQPPGA